MCNVETQQDGNGRVLARMIWRPVEKFVMWAMISTVVLALGTASTVGVLVSQVADARTGVAHNAQALQAVAVVLERVVTKLEALSEWKRSINVDDRYTTNDAAADRKLNADVHNTIWSAIHQLESRVTALGDQLAQHREASAHVGTAQQLRALEKRIDNLEREKD